MLCFMTFLLFHSIFYKEKFFEILDCDDHKSARSAIADWINFVIVCGVVQFQKYANTMLN